MKIVRTLKITPDEFFDYLESGIAQDLKRVHENDASYVPEPLATGLTYVKQPEDRFKRVKVTVDEYERGRVYRVHSESLTDNVSISYEVEPTDDGITVTFLQEIQSFNEKRARQNAFLRGFSEAVYLGKMAEALLDMQDEIIDARAGVVRKEAPKPPQPGERLVKKIAEKKAEQNNKKKSEQNK